MDFKSRFKPVPGENIPVYSCIVYGDIKTGKTTLASTAAEEGDCLLLNLENRVSHIADHPNLILYPGRNTICTPNALEALDRQLSGEKDHGIKFIIIDTLDAYVQAKEDNKVNSKLGFKINWDERAEINYYLRNFIQIFKNEHKINTIITCHQRSDEKRGTISLDITAGALKKINRLVDHVFYLNINDDGVRVLHTQAKNGILACQSTPIDKPLPDEILNPTWSKIFNNQ